MVADSDPSPAPGLATAFGVANLVCGAIVTLGVFEGLPARHMVVDAPAAMVVGLLTASGFGLVARARWGRRLARIAAAVTLAWGVFLVTALALAAGYLTGIYGAVGHGGAIIFCLVIALVVPYLVALPGLELYCLRSRAPR